MNALVSEASSDTNGECVVADGGPTIQACDETGDFAYRSCSTTRITDPVVSMDR